MNKTLAIPLIAVILLPACSVIKETHDEKHTMVFNQVIAQQRHFLAKNTQDQGFGPQSPRDIGSLTGDNSNNFSLAPAANNMNLCNIHFHKNAEHKGGEFNQYAGNGDGHGYQSGYQFTGQLTAAELTPSDHPICPSQHGSLSSGDTIEVHYVHSTADINPGPTLSACLNDATKNPQLRVETQVYVLVTDQNAADFITLTQHDQIQGLHQAINIPNDTGVAVEYIGSTTGPSYNEKGSPFQVTWNVRPQITKVNITTVGQWCQNNVFDEDHAHGVRNLIVNPKLLSTINP
jgi:hypothetical protein